MGYIKVTILILVEGSLQSQNLNIDILILKSHNPYFSRRFFAIFGSWTNGQAPKCHNPYFSRRFFAILYTVLKFP